MSIILVWKGKSACIVDKYRDPERPKKYIEKYLGSLGTLSDNEMTIHRTQLKAISNPDRMNFIRANFHVVEEGTKHVTSRKAATGDIREATEKKVRKPLKTKEPVKPEKEWLRYPETGYRTVFDPDRARFIKKKKVTPTMTKAQIDKRITKIKGDIKFSKSVVKHKKSVATFSKSQQISVNRDIDYHQSVVDSAGKAIIILQKQRSELKR